MKRLYLLGYASLSTLASCQIFPEPEQVQIQRQQNSLGAWQQTRLTISNAREAFALEIERDDDGSRAFLTRTKRRLPLEIPEAYSISAAALCTSEQHTRLLLQVHYGGMNNYYEYYGVDSHGAKLDYVGGYEIFSALEAGDLSSWLNCKAGQQAWQLEQSFVPCRCRQTD